MANNRLFVFDNIKFILISLVVTGHFLGAFTDYSNVIRVIWRWIYMFHMPAFLFIGGLFAKRIYTRESGLRVNTVAYYLLMGILLYSVLWVVRRCYDPNPKYDLINMGSIPWYFFALAAFSASLPIVVKIRGGARTVIPIAIVLGVIAGFIDGFDDFLVLGRIATFAPFYFAGFFIDANTLALWGGTLRKKRWPLVCALLAAVGLFVALAILPRTLVGAMSALASGHNPYSSSKAFPSYVDAGIRLLDYLIASIMIVSLLVVVPNKKTPFSELGQRTLQVYFLHPIIYYPLIDLGVLDPLIPFLPWSGLAVAVAAVLLSALLAYPRCVGVMFGRLKTLIHIDIDDKKSE